MEAFAFNLHCKNGKRDGTAFLFATTRLQMRGLLDRQQVCLHDGRTEIASNCALGVLS